MDKIILAFAYNKSIVRLMSTGQTYDNYFKAYFKTPQGRVAKNKAQNKYRAKKRLEAIKSPVLKAEEK